MSSRARVYSLGSRFAAIRRARLFDAVCIGAMLSFVGTGCESNSSSSDTSATKPDPKAAAAAVSAAESRCQQLLASGLEMMKPESLGITSQEQQVVDALNNWAGECGKSQSAPADDPAAKGSDATSTKAGSEEFADLYDLADIEHIRNAWLLRQLGNGVVHSQQTDLDRIVGLFDLTVRTVALNNSFDPLTPQTTYDTVVVGRGRAEDRAWVFGELLRQAGFDSVILRPKTSAPAPASSTKPAAKTGASADSSAPRWLVGVLLDKQVHLFDPTLGWPIPSPDDKPTSMTVRRPATLAQVIADDGLLRKLDVSPEKKYPLRAADLKSVQVEIITSSRYSEPRIKRIESFLAGNRSTMVYAPLADVGGRPGLRARVEAAGGGAWKKEDVSVWDYPDNQLSAAHHLEGDAKSLHDAYWLPFEGPVDLEFDVKTMTLKVVTGTKIKDLNGKAARFGGPADTSNRVEERHDARRQIKSRIAQLQGDYPKAIRTYLNVQLAELPPMYPLPEEVQEKVRNLPPDKRPKGEGPLAIETPKREFMMNFRAAEDAKFWMGVCQLDQHENESAEETFSSYLRRYGQGGVGTWVIQAAYLRSLALADSKKFALAVAGITQLAEALPENDVRRPGFELLGERWRTARDAAKPPESGAQPPSKQSAAATGKAEASGTKSSEKPSTPPQSTPPSGSGAADAKSPARPKSP